MSSQPYIGLRPFERDETDIFFGREQHSDELIDRLGTNHFLAVIGSSGCGKSSLVRTGLIAGLEAGYLATTGTHWRIVEMRPGNHPFQALANKLFSELNDVLAPHYTADTLQQALRQGLLSLHELLAQHPLPHNAQLLIVCDQFEEIFRYFKEGASAEARNFVSLLLASSKSYPLSTTQLSHSVYVVITMRSDYLGDCAQFLGLAEAINQGLYLTPRLDAEQLRAAIEEPAFVFDGEIEPELITQLLEDAENNQDQLPLLQHVLMRLWDLATEKNRQPICISLQDYKDLQGNKDEGIKGLEKALSIHIDEVYDELITDEKKCIAEIMFRSLTERGDAQRDTRRPTQLAKLIELTDASYAEVVAVIDAFRQVGCCFLMPPITVALNDDSVIDISHESLIRQWQRLKDWTEQEAKAVDIYKRLEEAAKLGYSHYRTPELEIALGWYEKQKNPAIWATRYSHDVQDFERAILFLKESDTQEDKKDYVIYCNQVIKRRGAIYPYGKELTPEQVRKRLWSFKLIKKGKSNPYYKMQIVNGLDKVTSVHNVDLSAYLEPADSSKDELEKVCQWEFVYDSKNTVIYEKNYSKDEKFLGALVYLPQNKDDVSTKAFYIDSIGYPAIQKNAKAAGYVEFTYSDQGDEIETRYFNHQHEPQAGPDKTYGQKNEFDENGLITKVITINVLGKPMNGIDGYAIITAQYDEQGNLIKIAFFDVAEQPTVNKDGYHKSVTKFDDRNNPTELAYFDVTEQPTIDEEGIHKYINKFDDRGNRIEWAYFDATEQPTVNKDGYHKSVTKFDDRNNPTELAYFDVTEQPTIDEEGIHKYINKFDDRNNPTELAYFDATEQPTVNKDGYHKLVTKFDDRNNPTELAYFDVTEQPTVNEEEGIHKYIAKFDDRNNPIELAYFDVTEQPTVNKDGYHKSVTKFDDRNNPIELAYFDVTEQPTVDEKGIHKYIAKFDNGGNKIEQEFFDVTEKPTVNKDGYHKITMKYNDQGYQNEQAYFDTAGKPTVDEDGIHKYVAKYDDNGNKEVEYFDVKGNSISWLNRTIYSMWRKGLRYLASLNR